MRAWLQFFSFLLSRCRRANVCLASRASAKRFVTYTITTDDVAISGVDSCEFIVKQSRMPVIFCETDKLGTILGVKKSGKCRDLKSVIVVDALCSKVGAKGETVSPEASCFLMSHCVMSCRVVSCHVIPHLSH